MHNCEVCIEGLAYQHPNMPPNTVQRANISIRHKTTKETHYVCTKHIDYVGPEDFGESNWNNIEEERI
jgi:hypothetical protein